MRLKAQAKKETQAKNPGLFPQLLHPIDCDSSANDMELKIYVGKSAVKALDRAKPRRWMRTYGALGLCDGRTSDMLSSFDGSAPKSQPSDHISIAYKDHL